MPDYETYADDAEQWHQRELAALLDAHAEFAAALPATLRGLEFLGLLAERMGRNRHADALRMVDGADRAQTLKDLDATIAYIARVAAVLRVV